MKKHNMFNPRMLEFVSDCGKPVGLRMYQNYYLQPQSFDEVFGNHNFNILSELNPSFESLNERLQMLYRGLDGNAPFPNCCHEHKKLATLSVYQESHFENVAYWTTEKCMYTLSFFFENYKSRTFKSDLRDFLDNIVRSFGSIPNGYGEPYLLTNYINYIHYFLNSQTVGDESQELKKFIFQEIHNATNPPELNINDFKILLVKYKEWLKLFPFKIPFLAQHKEYYHNSVIENIIRHKRTNKYGSFMVVTPHTEESLLLSLENITKDLLSKIKVNELRKEWSIDEFQVNQQALDDKKLELDVFNITTQHLKGKLGYIKALKKWLIIHAEYFKNMETRFEDMTALRMLHIQPTGPSEKKHRILNAIKALKFFSLYSENISGEGFNAKIEITAKNWLSLQSKFFNQRMENYNTVQFKGAKIELELKELEKIVFDNPNQEKLAVDYKHYLNYLQGLNIKENKNNPNISSYTNPNQNERALKNFY
jgi:hypothetical protein